MSATRTIRIGTRGSALAQWQTDFVIGELSRLYLDLAIEKIIIKTTGDVILDSPLSKIGDKGLFTKEIENALIENRIDLAVHSMKDLPTALPPELIIGAVIKREDPRDVFIGHPSKSYKSFSEIPHGGTVATGSLRRKSQLLHHRSDLKTVDLRGNLNTRLQKLEASEWDGMILAHAGVIRLGWQNLITENLDTNVLLPAVGQGAMAIEIRDRDLKLMNVIKPLNDTETQLCILAERALLRRLEGGCQIPIGALAQIRNGNLHLNAVVGSLDGRTLIRENIEGPTDQSESLGIALGEKLIAAGAGTILSEIRSHDPR